jgi:hypothetical protein
MELSSRFGKGFENNINLFGIIKEVGVDTEGLLEFESKYFNNNNIYIDEKKEFYAALGNNSLLSQPWHSWNPFTLYSDFGKLMGRMDEKKIKGNLKGEGLLKGGLYVISPTAGVVFEHKEQSGTPMPYAEIEKIVAGLIGRDAAELAAGKAGECRAAEMPVCTSREACSDA